MHVIGLTGGIACGKSTVSFALRKAGACVLDADQVAHELAEPGGALFSAYVEHFGTCMLSSDGSLDRKAIGESVFQNPKERDWLNQTTHPILLNEMKRRLEACRKQGERIVILDVPLLLEAGWDVLCDEIWVVAVSMEIQRERLMKRDCLTREQAEARIAAQMSLEEKCRHADIVMDNSGEEDQMKEKAAALYAERVAQYMGAFL